MTPDPSPFAAVTNRMVRPIDRELASVLASEKAIVRLLGPRRIGKTELVSHYARASRQPIVVVTVKPVPADLAPGPVVLAILANEIEALAHSWPKLAAKMAKVAPDRAPGHSRRDFGGEVKMLVAKVTAKVERTSKDEPAETADADVQIAIILRRLEMAAVELKLRPIVFFDEIQELLLKRGGGPGLATIWAIRNEVQHHTACRYVFAGSNQRLFATLQAGREAPLLNIGTAIEIPALDLKEIDAWALPLFQAGGRHIRSLAAATELLCGKIGEVAEVCTWLWLHSNRGDLLDEPWQRAAVRAVAREQVELELLVRQLTASQTAVLRWILLHPGVSPYGREAAGTYRLSPGTINTALRALLEAELIESFSKSEFVATTPLKLIATLSPDLWATSTDDPGAVDRPARRP
jgi:hypothetical protein